MHVVDHGIPEHGDFFWPRGYFATTYLYFSTRSVIYIINSYKSHSHIKLLVVSSSMPSYFRNWMNADNINFSPHRQNHVYKWCRDSTKNESCEVYYQFTMCVAYYF